MRAVFVLAHCHVKNGLTGRNRNGFDILAHVFSSLGFAASGGQTRRMKVEWLISGCDVGMVNLADHGPAAVHLQKIEKVGEAKA